MSRRRSVIALVSALLVGACGSSTELGVAEPTASPLPTAVPTVAPTDAAPASGTPEGIPGGTDGQSVDGDDAAVVADTGGDDDPAEPTPTSEPEPEDEPTVTPEPSPTPLPTPEAVTSPTFEALCAAERLDPVGRVADPELDEISGIVFSVRNDGVIWAHNDSGDTARLWALDGSGATVAIADLEGVDGVEHIDWEDMSIGPGPTDEPWLYVADIGDNNGERDQVVVYRFPEPALVDGVLEPTTQADRLVLTYPNRVADAETLLVDPVTGDLVIVTKRFDGQPAELLFVEAPPAGDAEIVMTEVGLVDFESFEVNVLASSLDGGVVPTAGDVAPDGSAVVIRTYAAVFAFPRPTGAPLWQALEQVPCEAPSAVELQGEALAVTVDRYITISEATEPVINEFAF